MEEMLWWKRPMRVLQYNLQVRDTPGMDPEKIARETGELRANVAVVNAGGIYAWYDSRVKYHHVNEFLPEGRDLLGELIAEFHKKGIRFVARFDFSLADDFTYLEKPWWFARHRDGSPYYRGEKRMGEWSLLLNTCPTGGYRNAEVAVPVLREALERYDIDGVFLNAPFAVPCFCERCRRKYGDVYGAPMPDREEDFNPGWLSKCTKDNIAELYRAVKEKKPEVPMILYYNPFGGGKFPRDSIYDRLETADLLCTESQDVLSRGVLDLPAPVHPTLAMKAGQDVESGAKPFGIIHSSPGMDWRHVGLPAAEYLPWMCQVPAAGGTLWHSVTGYCGTIEDKRILRAVAKVNGMIEKTEAEMDGAVSRAQTLLLWDGSAAARSWGEALLKNHIQFDLMHDFAIRPDRMDRYAVVIAPSGILSRPGVSAAVTRYTENGGSLLAETVSPGEIAENSGLLGVEEPLGAGEELTAAYLRFEKVGEALSAGMDTDKIAFRGRAVYCAPKAGVSVLSTLVPPFAPPDVVGAPPERASIPVPQTDIPLCLMNRFGKGTVLCFPFLLSRLLSDYGLSDHLRLLDNAISLLLGGERELEVRAPADVYVSMYEKGDRLLIHLVNQVGRRPLTDNVPVYGISFRVGIKGAKVKGARSAIGGEELICQTENGKSDFTLNRLDVWDMVAVDFERRVE